MTTLKKLLTRHAEILTPEERSRVEEKLRRQEQLAFRATPADMTPLEAQTAFILFEREFCSHPVHLFGQDIPSIAHTRIRIFRARSGGPGMSMEPAEEFLSVRISEKALTEVMWSMNRGSGAAVTPTAIAGTPMPARERNACQADLSRMANERRIEEAGRKSIQDVRDLLAEKPARSTGKLREALSGLAVRIRDMTDLGYGLESHLKRMAVTRNEVLTEASHAALHAERVARALMSREALPSPDPIDWQAIAAENPVIDFIFDEITDEWREIYRKLIVAELRKLSDANPGVASCIVNAAEGEVAVFPQASNRRILFVGGGNNKETLWFDMLASLWNDVFNPHLAAERALYHPTQMTLSASRIHGDTGSIHSSFPITQSDFFRLSLSPGFIDSGRYQDRPMSRATPVVEIEITDQDLMTALRGHPAGLPVPCSIRNICGHHFQPIPRPSHEIAGEIDETVAGALASEEVRALKAALERAKSLVDGGRSGKAWRDDLAEAIDEIEAALGVAKGALDHHAGSGRAAIDEHVVQSAEAMLQSISATLPPGAVEMLMISRE